MVTVVPVIVQTVGVVDVKITGRAEVAVTLTVVVPPTLTDVGEKLIAPTVWFSLFVVIAAAI